MARRTTGIQDEDFRRWIAGLPCMVCGQALISQAAHIQKGGMGIKGCDSSCRPLCADTPNRQGCHAKIDQNKIKLSWELRQDIINAPVYFHWKRNKHTEAMHHIYKFRSRIKENA